MIRYVINKIDDVENNMTFNNYKDILNAFPSPKFKIINTKIEGTNAYYNVYTVKPAKWSLKNAKQIYSAAVLMEKEQKNELEPHLQEQIEYRKQTCSDCLKNGSCLVCGCKMPNMMYAKKSCPINKYPPLLNEEEWYQYREQEKAE